MVKSAIERNFKANAISINPRETFTVFIHDPDFGNACNQAGNAAKNANGKAKAKENPNMPTNGAKGILPNKVSPPPVTVCTRSDPIMGPVQENDTNDKVNAIKKIPISPPLSAALSDELTQEAGNVIS